jgi:3-oxoadipate enol-lactonase
LSRPEPDPDQDQAIAGPGRTRYARNGSLRIAFQIYPSTLRRRRPWLLMIQGLGFDRTGWDPVIPRLRRYFRLIAMDNRGCGASESSRKVFSVADLAQDAVAVLDAAQVGRAHVMGASLGGMVAQEVAIDHADRVDRLVLACTTPGWPSGFPMPAASLRLMARTRKLAPDLALRRHIENALSPDTIEHDPAVVQRLIQRQQSQQENQAGWMSLTVAGARYYGGSRQTSITARTLVLQGLADSVLDPRNGALLAGRIPRAELVELPGLGHLFFWERPASLTDHVIPFLRGGTDPPANPVPLVDHNEAVDHDGGKRRR